MSRRIAYSLSLAGLCLAVLATRVSPEFERIRTRVVTSTLRADSTQLVVPLPDLSRLAAAPAAIIMRFKGTSEPVAVAVALDQAPVVRVPLAAHRDERVDVSASLPSGSGHQLVIAGDRPGWELTYLELANVHGHSSGLVSFVIVPRDRQPTAPLPVWLLAILGLVAAAAQPRLRWLPRPAWHWIHMAGVALSLVLFAATVAADRFSSYRILLSVDTFVLCAAILYAEPLVRSFRGAQRAFPRLERCLPHVALAALMLWSVGRFYHPDTGFTELIWFGDQFEGRALPVLRATPHHVGRGPGYDGQFYAQIALDPLVRSPGFADAIDAPGYRARRILLPWIAWLFGLGQPYYVLQAYALLNVVAWLALGVLLLRWLPPGSVRTTLPWIAIMLSGGLLSSMRQALPDGPSVLLLALGVTAIERGRRHLASAVLALGGLARETNVLGAVILLPTEMRAAAVGRFLSQAAAIAAPLVLWSAYLAYVGLEPAGAGARNFALPLAGYAWKWQDTLRELRADGWNSYARFSLLALVAMSTQLAVLVWQRQWQSPWWRLGIAYAALLTVLGQAVWEGHPGAVTRITIPMTVAFNIILPKVRGYWLLLILGNASVIYGIEVMRVPWLHE